MKILVSLALVLAATTGQTQTITVSSSSSTAGAFFDGGTAGTYQSNVSHSYTVSGAAYSFNLRGDVTAQMSGTADFFGFQAAAFFSITTGAAPVQLTDITVSYNGKEVLSGGSSATYTAYNYYRGQLYVPGFGSDFGHDSFLTPRTSMGVYIEDLSTNLTSTFLAANTSYVLYMDVYPTMRIDTYPSGSSMLGYSVEFGGSVAPWLDGVTVSFVANAVPEPASLLMLGAGVVALLAWRRRVGLQGEGQGLG